VRLERRVGWLAALALVIWGVRFSIDAALGHPLAPRMPLFTTLPLFLGPVAAASMMGGMASGLLLAGEVVLLDLSRVVGYGLERSATGVVAQVLQLAALATVGGVLGSEAARRRRAEQRLAAVAQARLSSEARYARLFASSPVGILVVDRTGRVVEANPAARELVGERLGERLEWLDPSAPAEVIELVDMRGVPRLVRPTAVSLPAGLLEDPGLDAPCYQVVLEDVTAAARREELARAFAQRTLAAVEDERRRLAQELHDGAVQELVQLGRELDRLPEGALPESRRDDLRALVDSLAAELRHIARGLRPPVFDDLGLVTALRALADELEQRSGIRTSVGVVGDLPALPPAVELAIYRIAQEALSNVERHAAATTVAIGLECSPHRIRLCVRDDGIGIGSLTGEPTGGDGAEAAAVFGSASGLLAPGEGVRAASDFARREAGFGLVGMRERARMLGGHLAVGGSPGRGTTVELVVPLGARGHPSSAP
jgi:signal transduction histidine kinase